VSDCVLVTGGTGFIGSHTCVALLQAGYEVAIADSLANSRPSVAFRIERVAGKPVVLHVGDLRDAHFMERVFRARHYAAVIHFAGLKAVGESVAEPLLYYDVNVGGSASLLRTMLRHGVERIVFSSSATVYGDPQSLPLAECHPLSPNNPYGNTKLVVERMLTDVARSRPGFQAVMLRYFNPVGAHDSGMLGEDPSGLPNNLMPFVSQVAVGRLQELLVYGDDYRTPDGTGVRDYVHVMDLARAHVAALRALSGLPSVVSVNLGTGRGYTVLEVIDAFERACARSISYRVVARRPGDVEASYTDPSLARSMLGWRAEHDLNDMCRDAWRWQQWRAAYEAEI
jgi:UDP-glucose 4-epimerase